jgi:hypothetical protein
VCDYSILQTIEMQQATDIVQVKSRVHGVDSLYNATVNFAYGLKMFPYKYLFSRDAKQFFIL